MKRWLRSLGLITLTLCLWGCAVIGQRQPDHSFSYDAEFDGWADKADLLEYRYGDKERMTANAVKPGQERVGIGGTVSGPMPIGEFLYVKWRIKATGEVLEDRVDLRPLLPWDMDGCKVTFVIDGRQLYVYLVTNQNKPYESPPILKTYLSRLKVSYEIYPNNTRPQ